MKRSVITISAPSSVRYSATWVRMTFVPGPMASQEGPCGGGWQQLRRSSNGMRATGVSCCREEGGGGPRETTRRAPGDVRDRRRGRRHPGECRSSATGVPATVYKINVMGGYAHPDDDTGMITPCGVWLQLYNITCGVLASTRGEGGGNAVGTEEGQALGLRRENEERIAHYRSGTIDFFFADAVDFFYNQSAPLTEYFWGHDKTLSRFTRIIRQTQPDIMLGHSADLGAGHGNHQWTGRLVWEGVAAAANPAMFPEQLDTSDERLATTWQVKKVASGGNTDGTGGTNGPDCNTGFIPPRTRRILRTPILRPYPNLRQRHRHVDRLQLAVPVAGRATSRAKRPARPRAGRRSDARAAAAYPTQSRTMLMGLHPSPSDPCSRVRHGRGRTFPSSPTCCPAEPPTRSPARTTPCSSAPPSPIRAACRSAPSSTSPSAASSTWPASPSRRPSTSSPAPAPCRPAPPP